MTLTVQPDGSVQADGQPYPLAAFWGRVRYQAKPSSIVVRQIPYPFTLPDGGQFQAMDYLAVDSQGKALRGISRAELEAMYDLGSGVTV